MIKMSGNPAYVEVAKKLSRGSLKNSYDTFNRVEYQDRLNNDKFQFPEEFISIYHHPVYQTLTDEQKWKLSLAESVNFFSVNIFGEQHLVQTLEKKLYRNKYIGEDRDSSRYMQHFIHEENSHTFMLAEYCNKYWGSVMPTATIQVADPKLTKCCEELLFFGRTFILEMFLGYMNRLARYHVDLDKTVKDIHYFHLLDEVRHIAWDKEMIVANFQEAKKQGLHKELEIVKSLLESYISTSFNSLMNPRIFRNIGIKNGVKISKEMADNPKRNALIGGWQEGIRDYFRRVELFEQPEKEELEAFC
jgi:para-aminobenzoate N-oxygenase AurF